MSISRKKLDAIINGLIRLRDRADDETALESMDMYPEWHEGVDYELNKRVRDGEKLYKCVQAHTSQAGWEPHNVPALWAQVSIEEWAEWVQPTGAQDAYNTGDKVIYNNIHYISTADNNVWAPGVYGWEEAN